MLGTKIKEIRETEGISLEELAEKSGLAASFITLLEQGKILYIDEEKLIKICANLRLTRITDFIQLLNLNKRELKFKVFNVSIPKTGTKSIAEIFCNYYSAHEYSFIKTVKMIAAYKKQIISKDQFRDFILKRDNLGHLEVDSASFNHFYIDILAAEFPKAKFIFVIRDCYSWLDSLLNMYLNGNVGSWIEPYVPLLHSAKKSTLENEQDLCDNFHLYIDGILLTWASQNMETILQLPFERTLILRTNEISNRLEDMASFLNINPETLNRKNVHSNRAKRKFQVLAKIDYDFLAAKFEEHCSILMSTFFPGYSLKDYLCGHPIPELKMEDVDLGALRNSEFYVKENRID